MALKYVVNNTTYDFGKSEYTTVSNKYKRLNYIANGKTYQLGLATDSTATQYSPLKMKVDDGIYYIGRLSSRSASNTYSYLQSINTWYSSTTSCAITEYCATAGMSRYFRYDSQESQSYFDGVSCSTNVPIDGVTQAGYKRTASYDFIDQSEYSVTRYNSFTNGTSSTITQIYGPQYYSSIKSGTSSTLSNNFV